MMAVHKTLMKTSVKDKASYFDEIIFLLYTFSTIKPLQNIFIHNPIVQDASKITK